MTETIFDSMVVKIRADSTELRGQLTDIKKDFGVLEDIAAKTTEAMSRVFKNFARSGELSFSSLKRAALSVLNDIANSAIQAGLNHIFDSDSKIGGILGDLAGSVLFGRASGGAVGARQPYLVGERGPELFVPESSGRIVPRQDISRSAASARKATNITINITNQGGSSDMTQRSGSQVAVAVRRAMERAERDL